MDVRSQALKRLRFETDDVHAFAPFGLAKSWRHPVCGMSVPKKTTKRGVAPTNQKRGCTISHGAVSRWAAEPKKWMWKFGGCLCWSWFTGKLKELPKKCWGFGPILTYTHISREKMAGILVDVGKKGRANQNGWGGIEPFVFTQLCFER